MLAPTSFMRTRGAPLNRTLQLDILGALTRSGSRLRSRVASQANPARRCLHSDRSRNPSTSTSSQPAPTQQPRSTFRKVTFVVGWASVAAFITSHVWTIAQISGYSMSPTLNPIPDSETASIRSITHPKSDLVLLSRGAARRCQYEVGDIVTLSSPSDPRQLLTKRILALPGDVVRVRYSHGSLNITQDGEPRQEEISLTEVLDRVLSSGLGDAGSDHLSQGWRYVQIPPGYCWVEGDASAPEVDGNGESERSKAKSRDSRDYGPVPLGLINGKVSLILWPLHRFGRPKSRPGMKMSTKGDAASHRENLHSPSELDDVLDSSVSPYSHTNAVRNRTGSAGRVRSIARVGEPEEEVEERKSSRRPDLDWMNSLSRGGKLGDAANEARQS